MGDVPVFVDLKLEVDGRLAVVKSLTKTRCWLLFDGERVATGFTLNRIRKLLSEGKARYMCTQMAFLYGGKRDNCAREELP